MPEHQTTWADIVTGYSPVIEDLRGAERGAAVERGAEASGSARQTITPEWKVADRGTPDTIVLRTRKGRSTFEVTSGHTRHMTGLDPVTPYSDVSGLPNIVRLDHVTLVDLADAWIAAHDQDHVCTCDDLTVTVLVLDKRSRQPMWQTERQAYLTARRTVRACHCRPFPRLMGLDGGRRNAWHEMTPEQAVPSYRVAQGRMERRRRVTLRRRRSDPGTPVVDAAGSLLYHAVIVGSVHKIVSGHTDRELVCVGHEIKSRGSAVKRGAQTARTTHTARKRELERAPYAQELSVIEHALSASDDDVITITEFPDVTVSVRRNAGTRWAVTLVRGNQTTTMRTRTAVPIARAVIA